VNKYRAVRVRNCPHCGRTHDSKMEARECAYLHMLKMEQDGDVLHIDVHPTVTLPGHIRWTLDFCVWHNEVEEELGSSLWPEYIDVKGMLTRDFKLKRQLFNTHHPAAPLVCVKWARGKRELLEG